MKLICQYLGGSQLYGLSTPSSDTDLRGIFVNDNLSDIFGLTKNEHYLKQDDTADISYKELRAYLKLLANGNSEALEALWAPEDAFNMNEDDFKVFRELRKEFTDAEKIFRCLSGYAQGELRLANGERTGKLGSKRKNTIDQYGFSYKNFVNLFRLYYTGIEFFRTGVYLVDFTNTEYHPFLYDLKTHPEKYKKEELNAKAADFDLMLKHEYDGCVFKHRYKFNNDLAAELVMYIYDNIVGKCKLDLQVKNLKK
jgi:predicted nucleotidyltransferase